MESVLKSVTVPTFWVKIYAAGDIEIAKQVCRKECFNIGLCVTIEPVEYIYTGGQETGYIVGLINYPRFPATAEAIYEQAKILALKLKEEGCQHSALLMPPEKTEWLTTRVDK